MSVFSTAWTIWVHLFTFVAVLGAQLWLAGRLEPKDGYRFPNRWIPAAMILVMVAIAAAVTFAIPQSPLTCIESDC